MKFDNEYKKWLTDLKSRIRQSQIKAAIKVNAELLLLYWDLGHDIVARQMETTWGSGFFEQLSNDLRNEFPEMQGFSSTNLKYCKRFFLFYTQDRSNRQQLVDELQAIDTKGNEIRHQVGDDLSSELVQQPVGLIRHQAGDSNRPQVVDEIRPQLERDLILQQPVEINRHQLGDEFKNHIIFQIPWGHHREIITKCKSVKEALFYVQKTIENGWSRAVLMNFLEADLFSAQGKGAY